MSHYIGDSEFNELCKKNGIDYNSFYGDNLKCVLLNNLSHKNDSSRVFNASIIGQHIVENEQYVSDGAKPIDIEVGGLAKFDKNNFACSLAAPGVVNMYMPYSQYVKVRAQ